MAKFIEEFLYTHKPGNAPAWHVVVGETPPDGWDGPPKMLRALTPEQAEAEHGFTLSDILGKMTVEAVKRSDALQAEVVRLSDELEKVTERAVNAESLVGSLSKLVPVASTESAVTER